MSSYTTSETGLPLSRKSSKGKDQTAIESLAQALAREALWEAAESSQREALVSWARKHVRALLGAYTALHRPVPDGAYTPDLSLPVGAPPPDRGPTTIFDLTCRAIQEALDRHHGNKMRAARDLGVNVKTLYNWLRRMGLR